jgi:Ca-activated chloride channel family protein
MKAQARQFIQTVVLACTICAIGANAQTQSSPAIPSVTTPSKNASQKIEPRKVIDSAAFRAAVAEARKAMDAGDFAAAEKAYAQAIAADSSNSRAQFNQGVAQYKSQNLQGSSESFATAGQIGDPAVAEGAMFNQGDAAYSGAIKIIDSDDFKEPVGASAQDQGNPKRKEAIDAAIEAATRALTHFKDAASADQLDIDARYNAETATRLLKMLEEKKKEEEKKQEDQKQDDKEQEEKKEEDKKGDQGEPKDDQSKGDQPKDQDQQEKDKQEKDKQEKDKQGKEGKKDEGEKGDQQEGKNPDKSEEKKEEKKPDQSKDGKEAAPKPDDKAEKQAEDQKPGEEAQSQESKGQESKGQASQPGEPVKDAPLTKQEADRLLQAVRDREKSRKEDREAKELQKPTRRTPASKDW